jgi:hypothetical protein
MSFRRLRSTETNCGSSHSNSSTATGALARAINVLKDTSSPTVMDPPCTWRVPNHRNAPREAKVTTWLVPA